MSFLHRKFFVFSLLAALARGSFSLASSSLPERPPCPDLVVYTYDSFVVEGGLGSAILPLFEKKTGCRVRAIPVGDGLQILNRLELDARRGKKTAQLVLGVDYSQWQRAKVWLEAWGDWRPQGYSRLDAKIRTEPGFLPFNYGVLAFIADRQSLKELHLEAPTSLAELASPRWKRNFILQDPRTSSPGFQFLALTHQAMQETAWNYWHQLKTQWLTLAPGWDGAYGLFLKKEAPLVWSYLTSQAYHEEKESTPEARSRYQAVLFKEGQPLQIEGAALVKGAFSSELMKKRALEFLEFLISEEVQAQVPLRNWMMPVRRDTPLPGSFQRLPKPHAIWMLGSDLKPHLLGDWKKAISR